MAALAAVAPAPARACDAIGCRRGVLSPADGASIPANAGGLPLVKGTWVDVPAKTPPPGIALTSADGAPVPFTVTMASDYFLVRLDAALTAGQSYAVRYLDPCYDFHAPDPDDPGAPVMHPFSVGPAAPEPATFGAITALAATLEPVRRLPSNTSCTVEATAAVVELRFAPAAEMSPYLPITRVKIEVDGKSWTAMPFGSIQADGALADRGLLSGEGPLDADRFGTTRDGFLFAECDGSGALKPGHRRAVFTPEIAGAAHQPAPLVLEVDLPCPAPLGHGGGCTLASTTGGESVLAQAAAGLAGLAVVHALARRGRHRRAGPVV